MTRTYNKTQRALGPGRFLLWNCFFSLLLCCIDLTSEAACAPIDELSRIHFHDDQTASTESLLPVYDGPDSERESARIRLRSLLDGFEKPTDIQFIPGDPYERYVVLEKNGIAWWIDPQKKRATPWFSVDVATRSEQGLLGLAFHPNFSTNGRFFTHYSHSKTWRENVTRISEWKADPNHPVRRKPVETKVILEVPQPWANHNGGQIVFGPDGFLYIGLGDGGAADDPRGHGQNMTTLLGSMLRIDINSQDNQKQYRIPSSNPFFGSKNVRPEIYAFGLRNPWRFTFTPDGRLIAADVGQNKWEEITFVPSGANLGWKIREGNACFQNDARCAESTLVKPIYTYGHHEGQSVTGGEVYLGSRFSALKGRYVFGDFGSGRLWALSLDPKRNTQNETEIISLGRWPIAPSTFARKSSGELMVADYRSGTLFELTSTQ